MNAQSASELIPVVDVVVPTTCDAARKETLLRALDSLLGQRNAIARPLVVVNGPRVDPHLAAEIGAIPGVRLIRQDAGSLPKAIEAGRRAVRAAFYAFLDDDDVYLPDALAQRLERMQGEDRPDVVATDGYTVRPDGARRQMFGDILEFARDPLCSLAATNWLSSCGGLFRTATVGAEVFTEVPKFFEWTCIAFRLAHGGKSIGFVPAPTFSVSETPGSLSRTDAYHEAAPHFIRSLLAHDLPPEVRRAFRRKLVHLEHTVAENHLREGKRWAALMHHINSLSSPYGFRRNASFTYRLLTGLPPQPA